MTTVIVLVLALGLGAAALVAAGLTLIVVACTTWASGMRQEAARSASGSLQQMADEFAAGRLTPPDPALPGAVEMLTTGVPLAIWRPA